MNESLVSISVWEQIMNKVPFAVHALGWTAIILLLLWAVDKLILRKWDIANQLKRDNVAVALALGVMNLLWMAALTGMLILEKNAPGGRQMGILFGWVLIVWGGTLVV